jgi:hypothetical protein
MKHELFDELVESVKEGGAYRRGEAEPAAAHFAGEPDPREIRARMGLTQEEFSKALRGLPLKVPSYASPLLSTW